MSQRERLLALLACALLAGCASTSGGGEPRGKRSGTDPQTLAASDQVKLGRGYLERGEYETAHGKLERALELDPKSVDAHTLMAVLYERLERPQFSEKHYKRAVELDPSDGSVNNNYGAYLCRLKRYDEADGYFARAVDDPFYRTPAAALANAGSCAARAGDVAKAEAYFRKSLESNPGDAVALYQMALLTFGKGDFLRARAFIQRFESTSSPDAFALDLAARIEERLGDTDAAAKYRERLKTEFPDFEPGKDTGGSNSP